MMTNGNYLDHLVLKALREDDEKALSHLFESQYNRLFRSGLKLGADSELVKESIQAVFKDLWQYRHTLSDVESFEAYLKTALKRRIFKEIKKQQKNRTLDESAFAEQTLSVPSYEDVLIEQQTQNIEKQQLLAVLEQLTPRQKEVVMLKYFEELSYPEIAERTSLQIDTIYKILHEAIKKLKSILV
jgi:RNA polymerase sigma-70 factor (ECF subfamily)